MKIAFFREEMEKRTFKFKLCISCYLDYIFAALIVIGLSETVPSFQQIVLYSMGN